MFKWLPLRSGAGKRARPAAAGKDGASPAPEKGGGDA